MDANRPTLRSRLRPAMISLALLVATACTTQASPVVGRSAPFATSVAVVAPRAPHAAGWVAYHRPAGAPISLTASDGTGLALRELDARAVIEDPLAFTQMRLVFDNPQDRTLEGTFSITLPPGAAISRFAMETPNGWQEGEVVEKKAARAAYEDFLHRRQDPALLEQAAGNQFSARVFPIPARGRKELVVSYSQELTAAAPYVVPLQGLPSVQAVRVEVSRDGEPIGRFERTELVPDRDFDLDPAQLHDSGGLRSGDLAVVRVRPVADAAPDPLTSAVFLVDTSASRALGFDAELSLVQELVHGVAASESEVKVAVVAFDQTTDVVFQGEAGAFGDREIATLRERGALGASDLGGALTRAGGLARGMGVHRVVVISDGVATAFETAADKLGTVAASLGELGVERLDAVAVGGIHDDALLKRLVTSGLARDGVVLDGAQETSEIERRLNLATKSGIDVEVAGARFAYPHRIDGVQPGDEVLVYAELDGNAPVRLFVGGVKLDAGPLTPVERPLLARAVAQAKIADRLDAERRGEGSETLQQEVVALSTEYRVLSPYTSMLVLESEADYDRFHIDRRALSDILTVDDGRLAVHRRAGSPLVIAQSLPVAKAGPVANAEGTMMRNAVPSTAATEQPAARSLGHDDLPPADVAAQGPRGSVVPAPPAAPAMTAVPAPVAARPAPVELARERRADSLGSSAGVCLGEWGSGVDGRWLRHRPRADGRDVRRVRAASGREADHGRPLHRQAPGGHGRAVAW